MSSPITDELHGRVEEEAKISKLKKSRSSHAGWLTRSLSQVDKLIHSPHLSVLTLQRDKVLGHLKKLQSSHDIYVDALTETEEIDKEEEWMEKYHEDVMDRLSVLEDVMSKLKDGDSKLVTLGNSVVQPSSYASQSGSSTPVTSVVTSVAGQDPSVSVVLNNVSQATTSSHYDGTTAALTSSSIVSSSRIAPSYASSGPSSSMSYDQMPLQSNVPPYSFMSGVSSNPLNPAASQFIPRDVLPPMSVSRDSGRRPVDAWIDDLVIGIETPLSASLGASSDLSLAVARLELDRDLPKVELPLFDGSPLIWPRFVEQFFLHVHSRNGLNDTRRIEILQSHTKGEAKKLIQGLGYSGRNYAQCLKELKFAFGHRVAVARAYIDSMTSGGIVPSGDASSLRGFYITVRDCITTLQQMCYMGELNSSDILQRASKRIPFDRRNK
jgi:hypothetical protein